MAKDVVCGMQVDPQRAAGQSEYQGQIYYFCSASCKRKFDSSPEAYRKDETKLRTGPAQAAAQFLPAWNKRAMHEN